MPLTQHELKQIDRAQQAELDSYLDPLEEEEGDEDDAINAMYDEADARRDDRRYRDEEES